MKTSSEAEFSALFHNAAIGIIIVNNEGVITLINQFSLEQFGYQKEEVVGQKIEVLIPQRYKTRHEGHRSNYRSLNAHNRPMGLGLDLYAVKKNGTEFPVEVSLSSYKGADGVEHAIAFVNDITVRKRSENALVELNTQLEEIVNERTQSLSESIKKLELQIEEAKEKDIQLRAALEKEKELSELKSRFVSLASHEFRTPLSTILSSAYLISKYHNVEDQSKREKHIERIASSVNGLTEILNDFLSVGKIEEGKIQVRFIGFDLKAMVYSLINEMNTIVKSGQRISYEHSGVSVTTLDPSLLRHIVTNLLSNAIKFSPENGIINVETSIQNNKITILVKDNGIGIPEKDIEHLFERFFRSENAINIQGTGLGLHIVKKYVELMNGNIRCESKVNEGTEFVINFTTKNI